MSWTRQDTPIVVLALVLSFIGAILSYVTAGATLGLLIGSVTFATLITPPLALAVSQPLARIVLVTAVALGTSVVCIYLLHDVRYAIILLAYPAALAGISLLVRSSTITTMLALAWLVIPVWLTPHVTSQRAINALIIAHPIFAANGINPSLGVWTQQPLMYRLTNLGQDVPYRLPQSIWPCVLVHGVIALGLLARRDPKRPAPADGSPSDR